MLDQIELVFDWFKSFNLKIKPKMLLFQASVNFLGHILRAIKRLASGKECQGIAFIPRFGILLSLVYPKLCSCDQMLTPTYWSNQHQEDT